MYDTNAGKEIFHLPPCDDLTTATVTSLLDHDDLLLAAGPSVKLIKKSGEVISLITLNTPVVSLSTVPSHPSKFLVDTGSDLYFYDIPEGLKWSLRLPQTFFK